MALNDDLDRQPIPSPIYGVFSDPRVVTLFPGEQLVHIGGWFWARALVSPAFGTGRRSFRELKAIGDMLEQLRAAIIPLRHDLAADHFQGRKRELVEGVIVEATKAYTGRSQGVGGEVFYIPGEGDDGRPRGGHRRAVRVVRRVVIR